MDTLTTISTLQPLKAKKEHIIRAMFRKLRTSRYMKASGSNDAAMVEFTGKVQRIVRVHQYGLKERPNQYSNYIPYQERHLLGFNQVDKLFIEELIAKII